MKNLQIELARKFMAAMKKHWRKNNPHVDIVMNYLMEKYGELPRPDHVAIRSISGIGFGIQEANSLFSALGYRFANYWPIPKLNIMACHFEPPVPELEKIFFSEIRLDDIKQNVSKKEFANVKRKIKRMVWNESSEISDLCKEIYGSIHSKIYFKKQWKKPEHWKKLDLFNLNWFFTRSPWSSLSITDSDFRWLSEKPYLQETTHVLAYGFIPNHFTFLLKDPNYTFPGYTTMENFAKEIGSLGIEMQEKVEGEEESILCQVSTKACMGKFQWPMSYIEFIKRGSDPASPTDRYEGFLPNQAQVLFKMTALAR